MAPGESSSSSGLSPSSAVQEEDISGPSAAQLAKYRALVDTNLRPLYEAEAVKAKAIQDQIDVYRDLAKNIRVVQQEMAAAGHSQLKTQVDVGSGCFVQAMVPDASRIMVHVNLGFHVEMTLDEALSFTTVKQQHLHDGSRRQQTKVEHIRRDLGTAVDAVARLEKLEAQHRLARG